MVLRVIRSDLLRCRKQKTDALRSSISARLSRLTARFGKQAAAGRPQHATVGQRNEKLHFSDPALGLSVFGRR